MKFDETTSGMSQSLRLLSALRNDQAGLNGIPSGAEAPVDFAGFMYGLKPVPFKAVKR